MRKCLLVKFASFIAIFSSKIVFKYTTPNSYGFIAQLVEHCTGIAEVTGSNPAEAWIFFSGFSFAIA